MNVLEYVPVSIGGKKNRKRVKLLKKQSNVVDGSLPEPLKSFLFILSSMYSV